MFHNKDFTMKLSNHSSSALRWSMSLWLPMAITFLLILSNGCASSQPPPTKSLLAAQIAIDYAERDRVSEYAAAELTQARDLLNRANLAVTQKNMLSAERFAQQSQVTTQLAVARTELAEAQVINTEMTKSIAQLAQEIQRNEREYP
jgi:hypothetical protein